MNVLKSKMWQTRIKTIKLRNRKKNIIIEKKEFID